MEKSSRTTEFILLAITAFPLLYLLLIWNGLPQTVPVHFGLNGQPDGFASKQVFAIGLPAFSVLVYLLLRALPAIDPKKRLNLASYSRIRLTVTLFLAGLTSIILYITHTGKTGPVVTDLILSAVFLLLAAMGNVMLTVPQNYFVGIKTPWALANETNWRKTHRLAGKLWVAGGLGAFVISLFLPTMAKPILALVVALVLAIVPYVYSYRLFKQGLAVVLFLLAGAVSAQTQTEETLRYVITQPAGISLTLEGTLMLPANQTKPVPVVMLIAGSGPTDRNGNAPGMAMNMYHQLADSLTKRGVAVLRYDKRGSGANLPLYAPQLTKSAPDFNHLVDDAVGFIRQLKADKRFSTVTVAGHSEGALVGMLAATQAKADRYISIAGAGQNIAEILKVQFANGGVQGDNLALAIRDVDSLKAGQQVRKPLPMLASLFTPINQSYLISWMKYDPVRVIREFKGPVLILQGKHDIQVAVSEAERLKAARPDAKLILFDTMNHVMKEGPAERMANISSYTASGSAVLPAVADAIAAFVKGK
ncbi:MAG TPA: alpha/beta fold hydrolase [Fibrella sp.]